VLYLTIIWSPVGILPSYLHALQACS